MKNINIAKEYLHPRVCVLDDMRYEMTGKGSICIDERYEIKSGDECKNAGFRLGVEWGNSYNQDGDFPACYYAQDGRNKVFLNQSPNPSRNNVNSKYSAICKTTEGTKIN